MFKLEELDRRYSLFRKGKIVIDLGAAPGGWSQYAAGQLGPQGVVIALDLLPMEPLDRVKFIQGDFTDEVILERLQEALENRQAGLVISDLAPNMSGNRAVDQPRSMYLAELAMDFASQNLEEGGVMVAKLFQGEGFDDYLSLSRQRFKRVNLCKPAASRSRNREIYLVARDYRV